MATAVMIGRGFWRVATATTTWQGGASDGWQDAITRAREAIPAAGRAKVQVWLSGALCPAMWLDPPRGLRGQAEWKVWLGSAAAAAAVDPTGGEPALVWAASSTAAATLAAAMPWGCMQALEAAFRDCGLTSVKPSWSDAFGRSQMAVPAGRHRWAAFDGEALTSVDVHEGVVTAAVTLDGVQDLSHARAILQRRAVTAAMDRTVLLQLDVSGATPASGVPRPAWVEVAE